MTMLLLGLAFVLKFWWLILIVVGLIVGCLWASGEEDRVRARIAAGERRKRDLVRRADLEHQQVLRGDPHGVYGIGWEAYRRYRDAIGRTQ